MAAVGRALPDAEAALHECGADPRFGDRHQLARRFLDLDLREDDLRRGTLPPARRACARPIAIACSRLSTFFPERPLRSVPRFRSCIAFFTFCDALRPYFAISSILRDAVMHVACPIVTLRGNVPLCTSC